MKITILTPTYNRAYILDKLYESLKRQTQNNFEWMIIDDGSSDNTKELIDEFKKEKKVNINYYCKKNGGKHTALNYGIKKINNELTMIVDSDDYLTENAIEIINNYFNKYKDREDICGYSFLRCFPDGKVNGMKFPKNEYITSYIQCRLKDNITGDKAEVYFTDKLKEFPFLEIQGEKFLSEDYVWFQMGEKYKTVHINEAIYVGNYLEDGLTKNILKTKLNSPIGNSKRALILCSKSNTLKNRIKFMIIYITYGLIGRCKVVDLFFNQKYKPLFILCFFPALFYKFFLVVKV